MAEALRKRCEHGSKMTSNDLNELRGELDAIDEKLVELFNQRANCVLKIGRYKQQNRMAIYTAILASMRRIQSPDVLERS